ncbi:DUF1838 family protein [Spirillospora sp. NPDC048819]|uniref:DUF1838 family protein n=1 Tax=Spirillospora sp. NPDC048819 TaxID=3155268 RepID=UPI0033C7F810
MSRRSFLALGATALALAVYAVPGAASADPRFAPTDPGPLYTRITDQDTRISLQTLGRPDGKDMLYRISGSVYVNAPGDTVPELRHGTKLFGIEGYNIRRLYREPGTDKLHLLTREIVFYTDPDDPTKILHQWQNPLNGRTYPVVPVNNDAVNQGPFTVTPGFRMPMSGKVHDNLVSTADIPPRYSIKNITGDDFGLRDGMYASWEMFDFYVDGKEARRRSQGLPKGAMEVTNSWTRTGPFVPWTCVAEKDTDAQLVYHARSWTLDSFKDLEPWLKKTISEDYPLYKTSPKAPGPNETSWTSFFHKQLRNGELTWSQWCDQNGR